MSWRSPMVTVVGLVLCGCPRKVPDHLRIDPPSPETDPAAELTDLPSALAWMLGSDPLARSPQLADSALLRDIEGGSALAAYVDAVQSLERGEGQVERSLQQLEDQWQNTPAVAMARGYRLRIAENHLANSLGSAEAAEATLMILLTPMSQGPNDDTLPRTPFEWLSPGGAPIAGSGGMSAPTATGVRDYADRWVLESWLVHPTVPLQVLAPLLDAPQYDGLRQTPMGQLVHRRALGQTGPTDDGLADLTRATRLALQQAAADRDSEQAAWAEVRRTEAEALGVAEPIGFLLERARARLTEVAGDDRAAGGALLALTAHRWVGDCASTPCLGVDRVETITSAGRWHPDLAPLSAAWRVIALKESLDTLEVGHDTVMFPAAVVDLVDALLGTGGGPLDGRILQKRRPDAGVWLALSRAVGTEGVVDWEGARAAIGAHLLAETDEALALVADPQMTEDLTRIRKRAIP